MIWGRPVIPVGSPIDNISIMLLLWMHSTYGKSMVHAALTVWSLLLNFLQACLFRLVSKTDQWVNSQRRSFSGYSLINGLFSNYRDGKCPSNEISVPQYGRHLTRHISEIDQYVTSKIATKFQTFWLPSLLQQPTFMAAFIHLVACVRAGLAAFRIVKWPYRCWYYKDWFLSSYNYIHSFSLQPHWIFKCMVLFLVA